MVKYSYVDQSKRFDQTLCNPLVGRGRVCNGAGVVVSKYHSSCVLCQCALGDFARINRSAVDCAFEGLFNFDDVVLSGEDSRTWRRWSQGEGEQGDRKIPYSAWRLLLIELGLANNAANALKAAEGSRT